MDGKKRNAKGKRQSPMLDRIELAKLLHCSPKTAGVVIDRDQVPTITIGERKLALRAPTMRMLRGEKPITAA